MKLNGVKFIGKFEVDFIDQLKRELLLFDKVGIPYLDAHINTIHKYKNDVSYAPDLIREVEYLVDEGLLFDSTGMLNKEEREQLYDVILSKYEIGFNERKNMYELLVTDEFYIPFSRLNCSILDAKQKGERYVNTFDSFSTSFKEVTKESYVYKLVLDNIPFPSNQTSWENILSFKSEQDSLEKSLRLRNWINEIKYKPLSEKEIAESLEHKLLQYKMSFKNNGIKSLSGILEILITGGSEIFEEIIKLKIGKLSKRLFGISKVRAELIQQEMKSNGMEVAYIHKINENVR
ncbi:MAG: hypothetical protein QM802_02575 [Agriterribacter sp.]